MNSMKFFQFHIGWYIVGNMILSYVGPNHLFHLKKYSIKTYGAPILQLADQFQLPKYTYSYHIATYYFCIPTNKVVVFVILRSNRLSILIKLYTKCRYFLNWMKGFYGGSKVRQANVIKGDVCVDCELPLPSGTKPTYLGTYIIECFLICFQI